MQTVLLKADPVVTVGGEREAGLCDQPTTALPTTTEATADAWAFPTEPASSPASSGL